MWVCAFLLRLFSGFQYPQKFVIGYFETYFVKLVPKKKHCKQKGENSRKFWRLPLFSAWIWYLFLVTRASSKRVTSFSQQRDNFPIIFFDCNHECCIPIFILQIISIQTDDYGTANIGVIQCAIFWLWYLVVFLCLKFQQQFYYFSAPISCSTH